MRRLRETKRSSEGLEGLTAVTGIYIKKWWIAGFNYGPLSIVGIEQEQHRALSRPEYGADLLVLTTGGEVVKPQQKRLDLG